MIRFLKILLCVFVIMLVAGCRAAPQAIVRELNLNLGNEPPTLDPALATDAGSQQIIRMIFASLVELDPATGAPQHGLATSWAVSADGLIWEFKLRDDAVWSRFVPARGIIEKKRAVNARDVVYSVRRVFDPRVGSGFAGTFAPLIRGAEQLRAANPQTTKDADFERLFNALGVSEVDDSTVRFILTRPASYFPTLLATWLVRVQPRESIEAGGTVWTEPGTLWTSGPYVIERWSHSREMILRKNDHYYDAGSVAITRITFAMIADTATALDEYKNGNLDSLDPYGGLSTDQVDQLREDPVLGKQMQIAPSMCSHYYGFNVAKEPFKDVLVRKAFVAALDRETTISSLVHVGEPARWFTRPGIYASSDISDTLGIPFNVNQAREYLRQSGYDRRKLGTITLAVNTSETHVVVAETIAQMWKSNLNVEVRVVRLDWKSYLQNLRDDTPQVFRLGYCAYYPDAANFANVFRSNSPDNFTHWVSLPFDQQVTAAARETDATKRRALYRAAEKMLVEEQAIIAPLWWSDRATLTKPNIRRTFAVTDGYERFDLWDIQ